MDGGGGSDKMLDYLDCTWKLVCALLLPAKHACIACKDVLGIFFYDVAQ